MVRWTRRTVLGPRVENFGDLIGPKVARQIVAGAALSTRRANRQRAQLGVIGSIIHMLPAGAHVWGPGVNGKHLDISIPEDLTIHAVRGPLTGKYLEQRDLRDPGVYGDPALLVDFGAPASPNERAGVLCIQNLNDPVLDAVGVRRLAPTAEYSLIIDAIRGSELVIGSSLHAIVVAEALGVPARAVVSGVEPDFKYRDYYEGTGRSGIRIARTAREALSLGGVDTAPIIDPRLLRSFPWQLWSADTP